MRSDERHVSDDMTPARQHYLDSLRIFRDKHGDRWYELPNEPDQFTLGNDLADAEKYAGNADAGYSGWSLGKLRDQFGPLEEISGFAMPGDTVTVYGREGRYQGLVSPGMGHWVAFRHGSSDAPYWQTEEVPELAMIEVVHRSPLRRAFARHATDPVFVQRDTKPLPNDGDRVRVETPNGNSFEGIYHVAGGVTFVSDDDASLEITSNPRDVVFTVLERAKAAEPGDDVYAVATGTVVFVHMSTVYLPANRWLRINARGTEKQLMSWAEVLDEVAKLDIEGLPLIELKRGEVIT